MMKRLLTLASLALLVTAPYAATQLTAKADFCIPPAVIQALS